MTDRDHRGARIHARVAAVILALGLALAPVAAQAQGTGYANPVLVRSDGVADPFILKWNGEYYLYATGDPIMAYHSRDLVHWDTIGGVLHSSSAPAAWNQADVWAPEVVYRNGRFYLYYTASRRSPDWRVGEYARRVGVAAAETPRGPFVDVGHPVTSYWAIDGDVFRDPDGPNAGSEWLFASYLDEARWHGAGITSDRLSAPDRAANAPALVTRGTEAWEDKDGDPNNGSVRYTNEGPTVFKRHGRYYMMYSGGSWDLPTYALAYAWSDSLPHGGLEGPGWHKVVPPILRSTPLVDAPGHNTITFAPNNVDYITAYHARVVPFAGPGDRQTFVDRVYWNHDRPFMEQPTTALLASPGQPLFLDIFDQADGSPRKLAAGTSPGWVLESGRWRVVGGALRVTGGGVAGIRSRLASYRFEANVRLLPPVAGSAAGVSAWREEHGGHVDVLLDPIRRLLVASGSMAGRPAQERTAALPPDFRFDAWHQLLVTKNAARLVVALDGVNVLSMQVPAGPGGVAVLSRGSNAEFDGVALTDWYEDTFEDAASAESWDTRGGAWQVRDGALQQTTVAGRAVTLKGAAGQAYEFTASVRLLEGDSASQVGIVAAASPDGRQLVVAGFDHTIWPFARFRVRVLDNDRVREALAVEMPRGFLYDEYHTIRVLKQGDAYSFWLDGAPIAAARLPDRSASSAAPVLGRPGLYTEGARAAFDDVARIELVNPRNLVLDGSFEAERWLPGPTAPEPPWQLKGAAQVSQCCGHSGIRRLLLTGADGSATEVLPDLPAGRYRLEAWVSARDAEAELLVSGAGAAPVRATSAGEAWRRVRLDFEASTGKPTITLGARSLAPDGFVAVDDVFLARLP